MSTGVARYFEAYHQRVYRWAYALCGRREDALDAVQEVFLRMLRNTPDLPRESAAVGWLRRVTSNVVIDLWRRTARAAALSNHETVRECSEQTPEDRETAEQLRLAIQSLSDQQRQVLLAKIYDRSSFAQIAAELGISISTAKTHYLRALNMVRAYLKIDLSVGSKP